MFGQKPIVPNHLTRPKIKPNYSDSARDITQKLQTIREVARENKISSKHKNKEQYDKTHNRMYKFSVNDLVLLDDSLNKAHNEKLSKNYKGPYKIVHIHNNQTATLQISPTKQPIVKYSSFMSYSFKSIWFHNYSVSQW